MATFIGKNVKISFETSPGVWIDITDKIISTNVLPYGTPELSVVDLAERHLVVAEAKRILGIDDKHL